MLKEQAISLLTQVKEIILGSESWLDSTHQPIEEAFSMAIEALKSTQPNTSNVLNALDTISRQAAIDAFDGAKVDEEDCTEYDIGYNDGIDFAVSTLSVLSSAQPEPCEDTISRQMAVAEIARWIGYIDEDMILRIQTGLKKLPSAQPELLTDNEQRIFLAAMAREEKVCKADSLVRVCHEITRKVKAALWGEQMKKIRLIDANAMMKRLKAWDTNDATDKALYNFALNRVLEAPTIEPERKKGRWIRLTGMVPPEYMGRHYCSECDEFAPVNWKTHKEELTDYCPHCGIKMKE